MSGWPTVSKAQCGACELLKLDRARQRWVCMDGLRYGSEECQEERAYARAQRRPGPGAADGTPVDDPQLGD